MNLPNPDTILPQNRAQAGLFEKIHHTFSHSSTLRQIYQATWGENYPEALEPCGWSTWTELRAMVAFLHQAPGQRLLDIGCGRGGPGLWIAQQLRACLVGIDLSQQAIAAARAQVQRQGESIHASYLVADILHTGWPAASFDAAVSLDTFFNVPDKRKALREITHLLCQHGCFTFTTYEYSSPPPESSREGLPPLVADHRPLLKEVGLAVQSYECVPHWGERYRFFNEELLTHRDALVAELGERVGSGLVASASRDLDNLPLMRRVLLCVQKGGALFFPSAFSPSEK
jgi:ubiquinone/menaquinone biosynthesis C-methylase UbiE